MARIAVLAGILGAVLMTAPLGAQAETADAAVSFLQTLRAAGAAIGAVDSDPSLDRITLTNIEFTAESGGAIRIEQAVADGTAEAPDRLRLSGVTLTGADGFVMTAQGLSMTGVRMTPTADGGQKVAFERAEALFVFIGTATDMAMKTLVLEQGALVLDRAAGPMLLLSGDEARLAVDGFDFAVEALARLPMKSRTAALPGMLKTMGYDRLTGSLDISLSDGAAQIAAEGDDLGRMTARLALTGTPGDRVATPLLPGIALALPADPAVTALEVDYQDDALARRALDVLAHQQGISAAMVGTQMAMGMTIGAGLLGPEIAKQLEPLTASVSDFLRNPRRLRVSVASDTPLPADDLWSAKLLDQKILKGLTIEARSGGR